MKYNLTIKKNKILPFAMTWKDLKNIMHSETTQTEKGKYCMLSLTCGIKKINKLIIQNRNRLTDIENKLVVSNGEETGGKLGVGD